MAAPAPGPGIKASYQRGWEALKASFWILLGITLLYMVVQGVGNSFTVDVGPDDPFQPAQDLTIVGLGSVWNTLVVAPLGVGVAYVFLRAARGEQPEAGDVAEGFRHYLDTVVAMLLAGLATVIGFILLIVPGIIVA
ncbi:MAG: hypothetical protein R3185_03780, partial [Candidatus Thermoplasmatota archaeon]|nr:hypothetical protein [Candidatus Thermoplasmatota archaeon]